MKQAELVGRKVSCLYANGREVKGKVVSIEGSRMKLETPTGSIITVIVTEVIIQIIPTLVELIANAIKGLANRVKRWADRA